MNFVDIFIDGHLVALARCRNLRIFSYGYMNYIFVCNNYYYYLLKGRLCFENTVCNVKVYCGILI